ncbi:hypothetical protein TWF481_006335 [Arthrobotrys musiformis]|uniref:Clr5 domain-containing protein n=1 Tax=Arthrobotrys musiformis TaxID=47236 RepID=A0AAV9WHR1_9PEZI
MEETPRPTRKRAPRCKELDNPLIRKEIEFRYGTEGRKLDDVVKEINEAYGLNATKIQYRERLHKWGCKQRLNHKEYKRVHEIVTLRKFSDKDSKVFLDSAQTIVVPEKRLRRWETRNITLTDQIFLKVKNTTQYRDIQGLPMALVRHEPYGLVRTPLPNPEVETWSLPIIKKTVTIYYPHIPIGQLYGYLKQILPRRLWHSDTNSALSAQQFFPHLPLLGNIIYQISNKLIFAYGNLYPLLDQVDQHGFRTQLKKSLSIKSPSILATCSALLDSFYFRRDDEMLNHVILSHPQLKKSLYHYLERSTLSGWIIPQTPRGRLLKDILDEISNLGLCPESKEEAYILLEACKRTSEDLGDFRRLWDPNKVTLRDMEVNSRYKIKIEEQILYSRSLVQLEYLLECGFTSFIFTVLFQATVLGDWDSMRALCDKLGIGYQKGIFDPSAERNNLWGLLDRAGFYGILSGCIAEIEGSGFEEQEERKIKGPEIGLDIRLLIYAACIEPRITKYAVEIIQWKYSVSEVDAARMAINALPLRRWGNELASPYEYWEIFPESAQEQSAVNRQSVLETLLSLGVDPNETSFWQLSFWEEIIDANAREPTTRLFKLLHDSGVDINIQLGLEISQLICSESSFSSIPIEYTSHETYTPIEIAFELDSSSHHGVIVASTRSSSGPSRNETDLLLKIFGINDSSTQLLSKR